MENWKKQLSHMLDTMTERKDVNIHDLQSMVVKSMERANADLTGNSQAIGVASKYIFKQFISYANAERIVKLVSDLPNIVPGKLTAYKDMITDECSYMIHQGESPVEMIIYATKAFELNNNFEIEIIDILKDIYSIDKNFILALDNILRNWSWVPQCLLAVKCCVNLKIEQLGEALMNLFEKKALLRQTAANAIIELKLKSFYQRIVNLYTTIPTDNRHTTGIIRDVFREMANSGPEGVECLLRGYISNTNNKLGGIFISALRNKIDIHCIHTVIGYTASTDKALQSKALKLLGRLKTRSITEILISLADDPKVDKTSLCIALGYTMDPIIIHILKRFIEDENCSVEVRTSALISLANLGNKEDLPYIESFIGKSPEFEIVACSCCVQLGRVERFTTLFSYLLSQNIDRRLVDLAIKELNRLCSIKLSDSNIVTTFNNASKLILEKENEFLIMNVLKILNKVHDPEIAAVLLDKLKKTDIDNVKVKILDYLSQNFSEFDNKLKTRIREAFVKHSMKNTNSKRVIDQAMKSLTIITRGVDSTPSEVR